MDEKPNDEDKPESPSTDPAGPDVESRRMHPAIKVLLIVLIGIPAIFVVLVLLVFGACFLSS